MFFGPVKYDFVHFSDLTFKETTVLGILSTPLLIMFILPQLYIDLGETLFYMNANIITI
jgi:hypothetical protein